MNNYYIYFHINLSNNKIFYVGKGNKNRAYTKQGRSKHWHNLVKKHGYDILLIEENLIEQDAFNKERYYINKIGRKDLGLGSLINHTNGGEDRSKYSTDEERLIANKLNYKKIKKNL